MKCTIQLLGDHDLGHLHKSLVGTRGKMIKMSLHEFGYCNVSGYAGGVVKTSLSIPKVVEHAKSWDDMIKRLV